MDYLLFSNIKAKDAHMEAIICMSTDAENDKKDVKQWAKLQAILENVEIEKWE